MRRWPAHRVDLRSRLMRAVAAAALLLAAVVAAFAPLPPLSVERRYSTSVYPFVQRLVTPVSNVAPFALFDVLVASIAVAWLVPLAIDVAQRRRRPARAIVWRVLVRTAVWGAALYLAFVLVWGLNYRRQKLTAKLQFEASRISAESAVAAAVTGVEQLNALHDRAHEVGWPAAGDVDPSLAAAFDRVMRDLGARTSTIVGRPKATLFDGYFRRAGVEGMIDPFLLETLVQRDLLPFERPLVVAHEWGHLAGFADESEASFVGWLTCVRGTAADQYSGWLFLYSELSRALLGRDRAGVAARLAQGPREDLNAIAARYRRQVNPRVSAAGWRVYDRYLKANRIESGTANYDEVVRLVLGVNFGPDWTPLRK